MVFPEHGVLSPEKGMLFFGFLTSAGFLGLKGLSGRCMIADCAGNTVKLIFSKCYLFLRRRFLPRPPALPEIPLVKTAFLAPTAGSNVLNVPSFTSISISFKQFILSDRRYSDLSIGLSLPGAPSSK